MTAEWAFTVTLGIVAYRDRDTTAVRLVGLAAQVPSSVVAPFRRDACSPTEDVGNVSLSWSPQSAGLQPVRRGSSLPFNG